jgi:prepilin-type N-terminal cleavage/methylation domain-containing protein
MLIRQRGFTLLEVMLVMLLLAITSTLVISSYPTENTLLRTENEIARQIKFLEDEALINQKIYGIAVYHDGLRYMLLKKNKSTGLKDPRWPGYSWIEVNSKKMNYVVPAGMVLTLEIDEKIIMLSSIKDDNDEIPQWLIIPDSKSSRIKVKVAKK